MRAMTLTVEQLDRLRRIAVDGPLPIGTRTTARVIGESGVRSLERRGLIVRFTVLRPPPARGVSLVRRVRSMARITDDGRAELARADSNLRLFYEHDEGGCSAAQSQAG